MAVSFDKPVIAEHLDRFCVITGSLVPVGLVIGNVSFETMIGLVGGGWVIRSLLMRENPLRYHTKHSLLFPWFALLMSIALSLLINGPGSKGWAHDLVFIRYLLFFWALSDISHRRPVAKFMVMGLAAGVGWAVINTLCAYLVGYDLLGKPLIRYTGKLKEASRISGMTAYAAPFFLTWGILDKKLSAKMRGLILFIGLLAVAQLLQTHVRTAILSSVAGLLYAVVYFIRRRVSTRMAVGSVLILVLVVVLFFSFSRMWNLETVYDRIYYWKVTWAMWQEHPVVGVGISSFQDAYKAMAASGKVGEFVSPNGVTYHLSEQTHAHNIFFMLISCTGILGFSAFCWLFVNCVRMVHTQLEGIRMGLVSFPAVFLTIGMTGFNIFHSWYQALFSFLFVLIACKETEGFDDR